MIRDSEFNGHAHVESSILPAGAVVAKSLGDTLLETDVLSLSDIERLAEALVLLLLLLLLLPPLLKEDDNKVLGHAQVERNVSPTGNVEPVVETETLALRDDE